MKKKIQAVILAALVPFMVQAELSMMVGRADCSDWSGIVKAKRGEAAITSGEPISYVYHDQHRVYPTLKRDFFGDAADWYGYAGVSFELYLDKASSADVEVTFKADPVDHMELNPASTAKTRISGEGWQTLFLPWDLFDVNVGQLGNALQGVKELEIKVSSAENTTLKIKNVQVTKGEKIALESEVQGRSVNAGETATYELQVGNTTGVKQGVQLLVEKLGWESMMVSLEPSVFELNPGEIKTVQVEVSIPASLPDGAREKQIIKALPNGQGASAETIEYFTAVTLPTPNIVFTADRWQEVREKVAHYDWAKKALAEYEAGASKWVVPEAVYEPGNRNQAMYHKQNADELKQAGIAYQVTGKKEYAEKVASLLCRLSREEDGYPATQRASGDGFVHEGVFFQGVARSYDMIRDSGVLSPADHVQIQKTMRLFAELTIKYNTRGGISNWNVAESIGALYCGLALQDWNLVDELLNSPCGVYAQMYNGIMSDGWWYECAVGYNIWVASEFSETAIALEPWGINLKNHQFLIGTTPHFSLQKSRRVNGLHGMAFEKWGSINQNSIGIKDMWDAPIQFLDYRGVIFAVNDAKESFVTGKPYELAYYLYRDPEYAAVINRGTKRDLLYGVPDLPTVTSEKMTQSAFADNFGAVMLRSQAPERNPREQIQAVLHYGSHGGHHGHFDRLNLINMMRYGRSFYNPEMFWYGYGSYLYKFLVQTSMTKNMVVVDQKQQEPRESFRTLFYTGDMMQATAVESVSRWSYPPYGGLVYGHLGGISFKEKAEEENRSLFIPEAAPKYGLCTDYTEEITQRRLMIMMDDYVVLADYLNAGEAHTYDWLMQIKGFKGIQADRVEKIRHAGQMNTNPLGSGQFITDCNWYAAEGTSRSSFEMGWGKGYDNAGARMPNSEEGPLKMDIFTAWPKKKEIMIGTASESFGVNKRVWYSVKADGETLVDDSTGAWILGAKKVEVDIAGKKELILTTKTEHPKNNTIFWGNAKVILKDGTERFISDLPAMYDNILKPKTNGEDYYGGPVKIEGVRMAHSTPGMPEDRKDAGSITIQLPKGAVVFNATLGGDFPMGDESQRRKTMAVRSAGKNTRYLSVIEPFETESVIKSVIAKSANELSVELTDGRVQEITISGFDAAANDQAKVMVKELKNGSVIREEKSF